MKYLVPKDRNRRKLFNKTEFHKLILRALFTDQRLEPQRRVYYFRKLAQFPRVSSKVGIRNRCIITGRAHGVYRHFGLSRFQLKHLANLGVLTGVEKTGW